MAAIPTLGRATEATPDEIQRAEDGLRKEGLFVWLAIIAMTGLAAGCEHSFLGRPCFVAGHHSGDDLDQNADFKTEVALRAPQIDGDLGKPV
jgi:hypothetical protein